MNEEQLKSYYTGCKIIFSHYGEEKQKQQLIQELSELITAITKNNPKNIIEEMADVLVMIDQFLINRPLMEKQIESVQLDKIKRQLERIKHEKGGVKIE